MPGRIDADIDKVDIAGALPEEVAVIGNKIEHVIDVGEDGQAVFGEFARIRQRLLEAQIEIKNHGLRQAFRCAVPPRAAARQGSAAMKASSAATASRSDEWLRKGSSTPVGT